MGRVDIREAIRVFLSDITNDSTIYLVIKSEALEISETSVFFTAHI